MKKSYLFVYSNNTGTRDEVKNIINSMTEIEKWRYDIPNCFYLISEYTAQQIAEKFKSLTSNEVNISFLITEIDNNYWGWLSEESWSVIRNKEYK